jgi:hypothetical protein
MALDAGVAQIALTVANAIHGYAESRGWSKDNYHIFMYYNMDWYTLRILVVAKAFEGRTEKQAYRDYGDLVDYLESRAKPALGALNSYGLVLKGKNDSAFYPPYNLGPAEVEIDEKLINHGVSWTDPSLPASR